MYSLFHGVLPLPRGSLLSSRFFISCITAQLLPSSPPHPFSDLCHCLILLPTYSEFASGSLLPMRVRSKAPHVQACPPPSLPTHRAPHTPSPGPAHSLLFKSSPLLAAPCAWAILPAEAILPPLWPLSDPLTLQTPVQAPTSSMNPLISPQRASYFPALISYDNSDNIIVFGVYVQKPQTPWLNPCLCPSH